MANRQTVIQRNIDENEDRISDIQRRLVDYEQDLWARFAAMEEAMAMMNQQTAFISSLFPAQRA